MEQWLIWAMITVITCGIFMLVVEWRNREYTERTTKKLDAIMQKLIDIKNR